MVAGSQFVTDCTTVHGGCTRDTDAVADDDCDRVASGVRVSVGCSDGDRDAVASVVCVGV
jgi:hypothetical protein